MKVLNIRNMILTALFAALTAVGAFIIIPLQPVPITLQTLFTLLSGALLGSSLGALSQIIYLFLGIIGLPVFAQGTSGPGILAGPTGGYLWGFIIASFLVGKLLETRKEPKTGWVVLSLILGTVIIYLSGIIQLSWVTKIGIKKAILVGVLPFLFGDGLKILAATFLVRRIKPFLEIADRS